MNKNLNILALLLFLSFFSTYYIYGQCPKTPIAIGGFVPDKMCATVGVYLQSVSVNLVPGVTFSVDWGDGTPIQNWTSPAGTNPTYDAVTPSNSQFYHEYTESSADCYYSPSLTITNPCAPPLSANLSSDINVWDDDEDGLSATPVTHYICDGQPGSFSFQDATTWNCLAPPIGAPHNGDRQIRWTYGVGADAINTDPNILIDGVHTSPYTGPQDVISSSGSNSLTIDIPASATLGRNGQIYQVRMEYWNDCNPVVPISTIVNIEVITKPPNVSNPSTEFCVGEDLTVTVSPFFPAGTSIIDWYADLATTILLKSSMVDFTFNPSSDPVNPIYRLLNTTGGQKTYYVTETSPSGCPSSPTAVTITVRNELNLSATSFTGDLAVCEEETGVLYTLGSGAPAAQTYGGATEYIWTPPGDWTETGSTVNTRTYIIGSDGTKTLTTNWRYNTTPYCTSPNKNLSVTVNPLPVVVFSTTTPQRCSGTNHTLRASIAAGSGTGSNSFSLSYTDGTSTYNFTPFTGTIPFSQNYTHTANLTGPNTVDYDIVTVTNTTTGCSVSAPHGNLTEDASNATVEIREPLVSPAAPTGPSDVCSGATGVVYTMASAPPLMTYGYATRYRYRETNQSNTDTDWLTWGDGTTGYQDTETDNDQTININTTGIQLAMRLRTGLEYVNSVTGGSRCLTSYTNKNVNVHTLSSATLSGTATICEGSSTNLVVNISGGDPLFTVVYNDGSSDITVNNLAAGNNNISVSPVTTTDYHLVSVTSETAPLCAGSVNATPITITVHATPTGSITGTTTICRDDSAEITFNFPIGVEPFNININSGEIILSNINDGDIIKVAPTATKVYTLSSFSEQNSPFCAGTVIGVPVTVTVDQHPDNANAGPDEYLCTILIDGFAGNEPVTGTGTWSEIIKPDGSTVTIGPPNQFNSSLSVTHYGIYTFEWRITNGICTPSMDTVLFDFGDDPTDPDVSVGFDNDTSYCLPTIILNANTPVLGTGVWSISSKPVGSSVDLTDFSNTGDPHALFTGDIPGNYEVTWNITSGNCPTESETLTIEFLATPNANAGTDAGSCLSDPALAATPSFSTIRTWSVVSRPVGSSVDNLSFSNLTSPTSAIALDVYGNYTLEWKETEVVCSDSDEVVITYYEQPVANAGAGGDECDLNFTLGATLTSGTGVWSMISGTGTASYNASSTQTNALATVTEYGTKEFEWHETNGICHSRDTITVNFYEQPVADAGSGGDECDLTFDLSANASVGTGTWTKQSVPGNVTSWGTGQNSASTTVTVDTYGTYTFRWTEVSGTCSDFDEITVNFYQQPVADAGSGGDECDLTFNLSANASVGTGTWTKQSVPGNVTSWGASQNNASTTVTVDSYGTYTFRWSEVNGTCSDFDEITVNFYQQPNSEAGSGGNECDLTFNLDATASVGIGTWTIQSGPGSATSWGTGQNNATTTVTVDTYGTYIFRWTEVNGTCSDYDSVIVNFYEQPLADAGTGGSECDLTFDLGANASVGTGTWTKQSVLGTVTSWGTSQNNASTTVTVDTYGTYVFRWTEVIGTCSDFDEITVNFYEQPVADAGIDNNNCGSLNYNLHANEFTYALAPNVNSGTQIWALIDAPSGGLVSSWGTGQTTAITTVTVNQYGQYTFTWTETNGNCSDVDTVIISFWQSPTVVVPFDGDICQGFTFNFSNTSPAAANYDSVRWVISGGSGTDIGTGVLANSSSVTGATYTPGPTEAGTVNFTLNVYGQGNCSDVSDGFSLTINQSPATPAITGLQDVCVGSSQEYSVTIRPNVASYDWSLSTISGTAPGMFKFDNRVFLTFGNTAWNGTLRLQETSNNGCKGDTVEITIQSYQKPAIEAGLNVTICQGNSVDLGGNPLGTGTVASGGSGNFSYTWALVSPSLPNNYLNNTTVEHPTASPNFANTFYYRLQVDDNVSSCSIRDTVAVTVDPRPARPGKTNAEVCYGLPNPALTATGSNITWYSNSSLTNIAGTGVNYTPSNTAVGTHTFYVTQTVGGCESLADSAKLFIRPNPTITVQDVVQNQTVCASNDGIIEVEAVSEFLEEFSINGGTSWETSGYFTGLGTDDYPVAVKNIYGCITYGATLQISAGDGPPRPNKLPYDSIYCFEQMGSMSDIEVSSASGGGGVIFWVSGTDTLEPNNTILSPLEITGTTTYRAYESKGGCTGLPAIFNITVYDQTPEPVTSDVTVCYGDPVTDLHADGTNIEWFRKSGVTYFPQATGNDFATGRTAVGTYEYYVRQTVNGCVSPYIKVTLRIKTKPAMLSVAGDEICYGEANPAFTASGTNVQWYNLADSTVVGTGTSFTPGDVAVNTYSFYVTQNIDGCESNPADFDFTIKYRPGIPAASDTFTCENISPKPFLSATGETGSTIKWYYPGEVLPTRQNAVLDQEFKYVDDTSTFEVTQTVDGCESPRTTATRIVYPKPSLPVATDKEICFGETPLLTATGETGGIIHWHEDDEATFITAGNTFNTGDAVVGSYPYKVMQVKNTCQSDFVAVDLIIHTIPVITSIDTTGESDCTSMDGEIDIVADDDGPDDASTLWYSIYGDVSTEYVQNSGDFTGLSNGFYPVVVKNQFNCLTFGDTAMISDGGAPPKPTAGDDAVYCANDNFINIWATGQSGTFTWYRNNMLNLVGTGTVYKPDSIIGTNTYWVTEKSGDCESDPAMVSITINSLPEGTVLGSDSICYGESAELIIEFSGLQPFNFTLRNGTGASENFTSTDTIYSLYKNTSGYYHLTAISDANGCPAVNLGDTARVVVTPLPVTTISPASPYKICKNSTVSLNGNPTSGTGAYVLHQWSGNTERLDATNTPVVNFASDFPDNYQLIYRVVDQKGCEGRDTINITVNNNPNTAISPATPVYLCEENILQLKGNPSGGLLPYTHLWEGDVPAGLNRYIASPEFSETSGTYQLTYTVKDANSCSASDSVEIYVNSVSANIIQETIEIYVNEDTLINGNPNPPTGNYEHIWSGNTGFIQSGQGTSSVVFNSTTADTYNLTYRVLDTLSFCEGTDDVIIVVSALPSTYITPSPASVCAGIDLRIRAHTSGGSQPYTHSWSGNTEYLNIDDYTDVVFNSTTPGNYSLTYTITDARGRIATANVAVTVYANPVVNMINSDTVCAGEQLAIDGSPSGGSGTYIQHEWMNLSFGADKYLSSTNARNIFFICATADVYGYIYYVTDNNGCVGQDTIYIHNLALPAVDFILSPESGCSPLTVNFTNNTTGADSYTWEFGDDSTSSNENPTHIYINRSNQFEFFAKLTAVSTTNQCAGSKTVSLKVYSELTQPLSVNYDSVCSNKETVNLNGFMSGVSSYTWKINNLTVGTNEILSRTFSNTQVNTDTTVAVQLIRASNYGCLDTVEQDIVVFSLPLADFSIDDDAGCTPHTIVITNNSSADVIENVWDFDRAGENEVTDNNTAISKTYTNATSNRVTKSIELVTYNEHCASTPLFKEVHIYPPVDASFDIQGTGMGCSPLTVRFTNNSTGIDASNENVWTFDDGNESNQFEPEHIFENGTGNDVTFDVKLRISNSYECADSATGQVTVYPGPLPGFEVDKAVRVYPDTIFTFTNTTEDLNYFYSWSFGDGTGAVTEFNPAPHGYANRGKYTVTLSARNNNSDASRQCPNSYSRLIQLKWPPPIASFRNVPAGCAPYEINFINTSMYSLSYIWDINEGQMAFVEKNPSYTFIDTGFIPVKLTAYGEDNMTDDTTIDIRVYPQIVAEFSTIPRRAKVKDDQVGFFPALSEESVETYLWNFGDDSTSNQRNPYHVYMQKGVYDVTLEVWNQYGCYNKKIKPEEVLVIASDSLGFPNAFILSDETQGEEYPGSTNDHMFYPVNVDGVDNFILEIYNRWGVLIRKIGNKNDGKVYAWDGRDGDGKIVDQDVYVWRVTVKYKDGNLTKQVGTVTVLK